MLLLDEKERAVSLGLLRDARHACVGFCVVCASAMNMFASALLCISLPIIIGYGMRFYITSELLYYMG